MPNRALDGRITTLAKGRRLSYSTWLPTRTIGPDPSRITSTIGVLKKPLEFPQNRRLLSHRSRGGHHRFQRRDLHPGPRRADRGDRLGVGGWPSVYDTSGEPY